MDRASGRKLRVIDLAPFIFTSHSTTTEFLGSSRSAAVRTRLGTSVSPTLATFLSRSDSHRDYLTAFGKSPSVYQCHALPQASVSLVEGLGCSISIALPLSAVE